MFGRNSCSGGSSSRIVVGSPSIAVRICRKSQRCNGSRASSAWARASSSSARISRSTCRRRSPRNMCSVRHSPMPSPPNRRARSASSTVSAFARTRSRRTSSARAITRSTARTRSSASAASASRLPSKYSTTGGAITGTSPAYTSPLDPSTEITSPSSITVPSGAVNRCRSRAPCCQRPSPPCSAISASSPSGTAPEVRYARHASVEIVNPGGTGSPSFTISARFAPFPPSRSFWSLSPSEKSKT